MTQKIAFFDIDGTLINVPTQMMEPSKKTIETLKAFQKAGNKIFIASARGSLPFKNTLISFDGFIGNDGHYIIYDNEIILDDLFHEDELKTLQETFKLYDGRYIFSGHKNSWSTYWEDPYMLEHSRMFNHSTTKPDYLIEQFEIKDIKAIACCVLFKNTDDLWSTYEALKDHFTMSVYDTGLIRMDIYRKGFTKGTAVRHMIEKLGFNLEDSYAFGDGENDMQMLQLVGHGVAMGNAVPQLKKVAKEFTDSVLEEGIANYFTKNGLCL
jgi:Cof subfamily protein (haloacid dehalogenase superfamily)